MSRLPGCEGQAADAVSAYTQVKMEDAPSLLKIQNVQIFGYVFQYTSGQNHEQHGRPSRSSRKESVLLAGLLWECLRSSIGTRWLKVFSS